MFGFEKYFKQAEKIRFKSPKEMGRKKLFGNKITPIPKLKICVGVIKFNNFCIF